MPTTHHGAGRTRSSAEPLPTVTGANRGEQALVQPFIVPVNWGERPGQRPRNHSIDAPVPTIPGSNSHALIEPFLIGQQSGAVARPASQPAPTVATAGAISVVDFLVSYYGTGGGRSCDDPIDTITARDRFALAKLEGLDILFRMLQPHELAAAQGFPAGYCFRGNRTEVVRQIGNAVPVNLSAALAGAALDAASGRATLD